MTKEILLKLIEQFGWFWYSSGYEHVTGGSHINYYRKASASDMDQFEDLIDYSVEHPYSIRIDFNDRYLYLAGPQGSSWVMAWHPVSSDGEFSNYSVDDINLIYATER